MIQILGLRPYTDSRDKKVKQRTVFFKQGYRAASVEDILQNHAAILEKIHKAERYNLYFTVANCHEDIERGLKEQWVIPFDIDGIEVKDEHDIMASARPVFEAFCAALGLLPADTGALFSGHGVQIFVKLNVPIVSGDYFDKYREHYKAVTDIVQVKLNSLGIKGKMDTSVFSDARLMRMPGTLNVKPGKTDRVAFVINSNLAAQGFDLVDKSGLGVFTDVPQDSILRRYPKPDTKAVCGGCKFLQHCKANPADINEPAWYAMLSVVARLDDGEALAHQYSEGHQGYSFFETEIKIKQALASAGPRTCKDISTRWDGCATCEHHGVVVSPVTIRGPDYIASKDTGYRKVIEDRDGNPKAGPPAYDDLIKLFDQTFKYRVLGDTGQVKVYDGVKWKQMLELEVKEWMNKLVKPSASVNEMSEFYNRLRATNVIAARWYMEQREGKVNFKNGTLDYMANTGLRPHSPDDGFTSVLPYDYDPTARAPKFEKFLVEVFDDAETVQYIKEFLGYCVSGDSCWLEKALVLVGEGANGKSVLLDTLKQVVGKEYYSSIPMQALGDPTKRYAIVEKFFNYSEETSSDALNDSELFKNLVTGGEMIVKQLYVQPYTVNNTAKFILSTNHLLSSKDRSRGFYRRLAMLRLTKQFQGDKANKWLRAELQAELPGIFNMLIENYRNLKIRGDLPRCARIDGEIDSYVRDSNPFSIFTDTYCEIEDADAGSYVLKEDLYSAYKLWAERVGFRAVNIVHFFREMRRVIPNLDDRTTRITLNTKRPLIIKGVKLQGD